MFKSAQIGTLHLKGKQCFPPICSSEVHLVVEEVREVKDINYCIIKYEDEERHTNVIHPKEISEQKWVDHPFTL
jgi:hypothetical protein